MYRRLRFVFKGLTVGGATWEACSGNLEVREPSQHLLEDPGKLRKTCVEIYLYLVTKYAVNKMKATLLFYLSICCVYWKKKTFCWSSTCNAVQIQESCNLQGRICDFCVFNSQWLRHIYLFRSLVYEGVWRWGHRGGGYLMPRVLFCSVRPVAEVLRRISSSRNPKSFCAQLPKNSCLMSSFPADKKKKKGRHMLSECSLFFVKSTPTSMPSWCWQTFVGYVYRTEAI